MLVCSFSRRACHESFISWKLNFKVELQRDSKNDRYLQSYIFFKHSRTSRKAFIANAKRNKWILRKDIKRFVGKKIGGVKVTESGILAAAHLAGAGSVKKYLRSYGANNFADGYGTTVRYYLKRFSGYDTSFITPEKRAKVSI